jgi:hypothetical protein
VLEQSDDDISCDLFEEFDAGTPLLHKESLAVLAAAGLVDAEIARLSEQMLERWLDLQSREWSFDEIRTVPEWHELFSVGDEQLLARLHAVGELSVPK